MKNVKYNDKLDFPNLLDLKEFSTEEIMKHDKKSLKKGKLQSQVSKAEDGKFDGLEEQPE
jgi:hypothetical protein